MHPRRPREARSRSRARLRGSGCAGHTHASGNAAPEHDGVELRLDPEGLAFEMSCDIQGHPRSSIVRPEARGPDAGSACTTGVSANGVTYPPERYDVLAGLVRHAARPRAPSAWCRRRARGSKIVRLQAEGADHLIEATPAAEI